MTLSWMAGFIAAAPPVAVDLEPLGDDGLGVGRPVQVVFSVTHAETGVVVWSDDVRVSDDVVIRDRRVERERRADGTTVVDRLVLELVPFGTGPQTIRPAGARLGPDELDLPAARFVVPSSLPASVSTTSLSQEDVERLAAPDPTPPVVQRIDWTGPAAGLGALVAAGLAWWGWRRWRRRTPAAAESPLLPPRAQAQRALATLRADLETIPASLTIEEAYVQLSSILRRYVGQAFDLDAEEMTNSELEAGLSSLPRSELRTLLELLVGADFVKFARATVTRKHAREDVDRAMAWIDRAAEPSPPPSSGPGGPSPAAFPRVAPEPDREA
jgi:hypothetical protein